MVGSNLVKGGGGEGLTTVTQGTPVVSDQLKFAKIIYCKPISGEYNYRICNFDVL